ncbi:hypothetical protein BC936DRAFT_148440 [Jimgerdemannia flammicorona]|uniref:Uncharacterized protein n=1 Tax=Jimgerdemannia flammicorona TaxID=994334 RepID=A0A433D320_9FUNG|nr:hypothetical protein BC936DRAFT_148440 [Jimgerdemannia flammicorona]
MGNFVFDPFNEQPDAEDRVTRIFQAARFLRYESGPPPVDPSLPPGFKWIGDRGFKPEGNPAYPNPCDATEVLRLNNQHKQIRTVLQGNQMAPVHEQLKNGARVLDAGCVKQFLTLRDINTDYALTLGEVLKSAALQDVVFDHREIPIGWGPEEIAIPTAKTFENTLRCLKPQATIALGLGDKEFDEMVEEVLMEIVSQKCYWNVFYAYGRKP